ncbi:MAG TPA: YhfC family glutamic-type intramembrane protease [Ktedonobacterales bacterium]
MPLVSAGWWAASIATAAFVILLPIALIVFAHVRLRVAWRYAAWGALIFFLFQLVTRVPLIQVAQYFLTPQLRASRALLLAFILFAALTAGIFEEVGRYVGYRWLMGREEKTWAKGVMYGLGHGGLESAVLIGGVSILQLVNIGLIVSTNMAIVPAAQRATAAHEIATIAAQPGWLPLLGGWERVCALTAHVALSLIVLQVFRRGSLGWLWLAIGLHFLLDATVALNTFGPFSARGNLLLTEGVITLLAIGAAWVIFVLRDRSAAPSPATSDEAALDQPAA